MTGNVAYIGLFVAAFVAATVVPAQSEAVLAGLVLDGGHSLWALVLTASVGNVLGATVNWGLGRGGERFRDRSWFPLKGPALGRAKGWYRRYGR